MHAALRSPRRRPRPRQVLYFCHRRPEVGGLGLGEWSARNYQWQYSFPLSVNPASDTTGERCGFGQSGPVFFLATAVESVVRSCTVPLGATVFVPLIGSECSTAEPPPWHGDDEAELRTCAQTMHDNVPPELLAQIELTVDGEALADMDSYRALTPAFELNLPPDNLLGVDAGIALAVADGYQALLAPLSEGEHEIVASVPGENGPLVATYHLTVVATGEPGEPGDADVAAPSPAANGDVTNATDEFDGMVDVGNGRGLHVRCTGVGSPTVIISPGGPDDVGATSLVGNSDLIAELAGITRFCAYDRAGLGDSDPAAISPQTFTESAADLHALLSSPELACPCVLIGQSFGGGIVLVLAATHPEDIAGLVLEDALPPGFIDRFLELAPAGSDEAGLAAGIPNPEDFDMIASFRQIETPALPDSVPVVVLTHGEGNPPPCFPCSPEYPVAEFEGWWQEAEAGLADALHGELMAVEGASHFIGDDRPDAVVAAVQRVVEAVRDPSSWATPVA